MREKSIEGKEKKKGEGRNLFSLSSKLTEREKAGTHHTLYDLFEPDPSRGKREGKPNRAKSRQTGRL